MYTCIPIQIPCLLILTISYCAVEVGSPGLHIVCSVTIENMDTNELHNRPV